MKIRNVAEQAAAVHVGHFQVAEDQREGSLLQLLQRLFAGSGDDHLEAGPLEDVGDQLADFLLVVHHQAIEAGRVSGLPRRRLRRACRGGWKPAGRSRMSEPPPRYRLDLNRSAMRLHDAVAERQADPRSRPDLLGGEEGFEDARQDLLGDPGAGVGDTRRRYCRSADGAGSRPLSCAGRPSRAAPARR